MITGKSNAHRPLKKVCSFSFVVIFSALAGGASLREIKNQAMLMTMVR